MSVIWLSLCGSGTQRSCGPQLWLQLVKGLGVNLWAKPEGSTVGRWDQDASTDVPAISCYPHVPADEMHLCELPCSPQRCGCSQALLRAKAGPCTRSKCFAFPGTLILFSNCKGSFEKTQQDPLAQIKSQLIGFTCQPGAYCSHYLLTLKRWWMTLNTITSFTTASFLISVQL